MTLLRKLADFLYGIITYIVVVFGLVPLFGFIMKVLNRTEVHNVHYVQKSEPPFLFISNHVTMLDDAFLGPLIFWPRALWNWRFIPYHTPEKKNFFRGRFFSFVMWAARSVPFTRGQGVFQPGMERVIRLLKTGHIVHIYPEGTRTRSGDIGKGKIGVGRMIRETGAKVIPCYHTGLEKVLPIGTKIPKTGNRIKVLIGEPIYFDEFMDLPNAPKTWQMISDRMIEAIKVMQDRMRSEWNESEVETHTEPKTTPVQ